MLAGSLLTWKTELEGGGMSLRAISSGGSSLARGVILPPEQLSTNLGCSGNGLQMTTAISMTNYQDDIQNDLANDS